MWCWQPISSVVVSLFSNLVVVAVMLLRPQKLRSTHVLIMALAASDIMFSLVIHANSLSQFPNHRIRSLSVHKNWEKEKCVKIPDQPQLFVVTSSFMGQELEVTKEVYKSYIWLTRPQWPKARSRGPMALNF